MYCFSLLQVFAILIIISMIAMVASITLGIISWPFGLIAGIVLNLVAFGILVHYIVDIAKGNCELRYIW